MLITARHVCRDYNEGDRPAADGQTLQHHDQFGLHRRPHGRVRRPPTRRRWPATTPAPAAPASGFSRVRRSARSQGRPDRLDRAHPLHRDTRIRREGPVQRADLSAAPADAYWCATARRRPAARPRQDGLARSEPARSTPAPSAARRPTEGKQPSNSAHVAGGGEAMEHNYVPGKCVTIRDGLRLHVRHYLAHGSLLRPVLCLPGSRETPATSTRWRPFWPIPQAAWRVPSMLSTPADAASLITILTGATIPSRSRRTT